MSHEHEAPTDGSGPAFAEEPPVTPSAEVGVVLARARRILNGDIRPEDYLPVTPEVRAAVDFEMTYVRGRTKVEPLPEIVTHQLREWLLSFHCGDQNIVYVSNDRGVIVLASGDAIGDLIDHIPAELREGVVFTTPEPF
jgi:hypothetical protein